MNTVTIGNRHYSVEIVTKNTRNEYVKKYKGRGNAGHIYDQVASMSGAKIKKEPEKSK